MKYDLAQLVRRKSNPRRSVIEVRPIVPTNALASDLFEVYRPIVDYLAAQAPAIVAAYERALPLVGDAAGKSVDSLGSDPVRLVDADGDGVTSVLSSIGAFLTALVQSQAPQLTGWADRVSRWHAERWRNAVLTASNVDLETVLMASGQPQSVADSIAWNVRLLADVSDQGQARISSAVFAALHARTPARDLARTIREAVGMSRTRALGIAADQLGKISSALDRERATDAGLETYTWRHSAKLHPRPEHVARNGNVYRYDTPPEDGPPGTQPWCGCRAQARLEL